MPETFGASAPRKPNAATYEPMVPSSGSRIRPKLQGMSSGRWVNAAMMPPKAKAAKVETARATASRTPVINGDPALARWGAVARNCEKKTAKAIVKKTPAYRGDTAAEKNSPPWMLSFPKSAMTRKTNARTSACSPEANAALFQPPLRAPRRSLRTIR